MKLLTEKDPPQIGQMVKHPEFKTWYVITGKKSESWEVKLSGLSGYKDVSLWDRRPMADDDLKQVLINLNDKEEIIAGYYRREQKKDEKIDELQTHVNNLTRSTERLQNEKQQLEQAGADNAQLQIQIGNMEMKHKEEIAAKDKELGKLRKLTINNETDADLLKSKNKELIDLRKTCADQVDSIMRLNKRIAAMSNTDYRAGMQETAVQFITIADNIDNAPQDVLHAKMLSDGWNILSINLKPTWLYDEKGSTRDISHTMRYIAYSRNNPNFGNHEDEEEVELNETMDDAIRAALNKTNDGSHIAQLTAPIVPIADEGFKAGETES